MRTSIKTVFLRVSPICVFFMIAGVLHAQSIRNLIISSEFEAQCVLPWEKGVYYKEDPSMLVACQGNSVSYTASINLPDTLITAWNWDVIGGEIVWSQDNVVSILWGYGTVGQVSVVAASVYADECSQTKSVRLIESPVSSVISNPSYTVSSDGMKIISVCRGETVEFIAKPATNNTDIVGHYWNSSMGGTSSTPYYKIEDIQVSGKVNYSVYNNCGCFYTEEFFIEVMDGEPIRLSCFGTVCEDAIVSYTAEEPPCDNYYWYVDGGTIMSGQNSPTVSIQWDRPQNGYGFIGLDGALCGNEACPNLMRKTIPIIQDHIEIEGQTEACVEDAVVYRIPLWGATEYDWTITPSNGIAVSAMNGANERSVIFQQAGTYSITVNYRCEFLGCGEYTSETKIVTVRPNLAITGEKQICISHPCDLTTEPLVVAQWQVLDRDSGNEFIYSASGATLSYTFPHPGKYVITATNPVFCRPATFILDVKNVPPLSYHFSSNNTPTACPNEAVLLSVYQTNPNYSVIWEPLCSDASPSSVSGNEVSILFGDTVCNIRTYTYDRLLGCRSTEAAIFPVRQRNFSDHHLPTLSSVCPGEIIHWGVPRQEGMLYRWTIQETKQHLASIQGDAMKDSVHIAVHERTSGVYGDTFYVVLERQCCGRIRYDTMYIHVSDQRGNSLLTIIPSQTEICPGTTIFFQGSAVDSTKYRWLVDGRTIRIQGDTFQYKFNTSGEHIVSAYHSNIDICTKLDYYDSAVTAIHVWNPPIVDPLYFDGEYIFANIESFGRYTFTWYYNGYLQADENLDSISYRGQGTYIIRVTNANGCTSERRITLRGSNPIPVPECDDVGWDTIINHFCDNTVELVSNIDTNLDISWSVNGGPCRTIGYTRGGHGILLQKERVGHAIITATAEDSICRRSQYNFSVRFIPKFTFEKNCNEIIIHNNSLSLDGTEHINFTVDGHDSCGFNFLIKEYHYPITENGQYRFTLHVVVNGDTHTCEYPPIEINNPTRALSISSANTHSPDQTCNNTPIELTATLNPPIEIKTTTWDFGDGTFFTKGKNSISHTFAYIDGQNNIYSVVAMSTDTNGCTITSSPFTFYSNRDNMQGGILREQSPVILCPGSPRNIYYTISGCDYYWNFNPPPVQSNIYSTYKTGTYKVKAINQNYCQGQSNINVAFLTAPTAVVVTDKNDYCLGEDIYMYGATGPDTDDYSFHWQVSDSNNATTDFYSATAKYSSPSSGSYSIALTIVSRETGCSSSDVKTVVVHPTPEAPVVAYGGNRCIDNPPVILTGSSPITNNIQWSNGNYGTTAYYTYSGPAIAYYYDTIAGCKSKETVVDIASAPDWNAMPAGCYQKCMEYFPGEMNIWGMTMAGQTIDWNWLWNNTGTPIDYGNGNYTDIPLALTLPDYGDYRLDVLYDSGNCATKSPILSIIPKEVCDCEDVDVNVENVKIEVVDCEIKYDVTIRICYNGKDFFCIDDIIPLFTHEDGIIINDLVISHDILYTDDCAEVNIQMSATQLRLHSAVFQIIDNCLNCTKEFNIDLMPLIECEVPIEHLLYELHSDFCDDAVVFFKIDADISAYTILYDFYSVPPMLVDYSFDGVQWISGISMFDIALLTEMSVAGSEVCFYAIVCENDKICKLEYCIPAKDLLLLLQNRGQTKENNIGNGQHVKKTDVTNSGKIILQPNPTTGEVRVTGAKDEVAEAAVLDMHGRQVALFPGTDRFNVSSLAAGTYIVRLKVRDGDSLQTYYLKLVKK